MNNNNNLTDKQFELLSDLFIILHANQKDINKDNILDKLQNEIISTMSSYWALVDEIKDLKKINNYEF